MSKFKVLVTDRQTDKGTDGQIGFNVTHFRLSTGGQKLLPTHLQKVHMHSICCCSHAVYYVHSHYQHTDWKTNTKLWQHHVKPYATKKSQ